MKHQIYQRLALAGLLVVSNGCVTSPGQWVRQGLKVGPDYCRPKAEVSGDWIDQENPHVVAAEVDYRNWWSVFSDPVLDALQQKAADENLQLRQAAMRIVEARALLNVARGTLFPQDQQAYGSYQRVQNSQNTAIVLPELAYDSWSVGFNASWELDMWGRFRRLTEAAEANYESEIFNYDDVLVVLQGEVAAAYIQMRTLQERLEIVRRNVDLQEGTYELTQKRFENGRVSELDVAQALTSLGATRAAIPPLEEALRKTQNALCVLVGEPPSSLEADMPSGLIPQPPSTVVVGIPAELLRRRPDIRQAERQVAIQSALIGINEAQLYPQIAITGSIGLEAEDFSDLFDSDSFVGSVGPGFRWNVLNYGRLINGLRAQEARFQQAVLGYRSAVLAADREVEDGIVSFLKEQERVAYLQDTVTAAERAVKIASLQYQEGKADFQRVLDSQRELVTRQAALAESRGQVSHNLVSVYKALGGGWLTRCEPQDSATSLPSVVAVSAPAAQEPQEEEELPTLLLQPTPTDG